MKIEVSLNKEDSELFNSFAKVGNENFPFMTMYSVVDTVLNDLEDLKSYLEAMEEYKKNPVSYPIAEVWDRLGIE